MAQICSENGIQKVLALITWTIAATVAQALGNFPQSHNPEIPAKEDAKRKMLIAVLSR